MRTHPENSSQTVRIYLSENGRNGRMGARRFSPRLMSPCVKSHPIRSAGAPIRRGRDTSRTDGILIAQMTYSEKLKDKRWQALRQEVLKRDNHRCCHCGSWPASLQVHHINYKTGLRPWEYSLDDLISLCSSCHDDMEEAIFTVRKAMAMKPNRIGEILALCRKEEEPLGPIYGPEEDHRPCDPEEAKRIFAELRKRLV